MIASHWMCFLEEVNKRDDVDSADSAIWMRILAQRRSTKIYIKLMQKEKVDAGKSAKSGSNSGAYTVNLSNLPFQLVCYLQTSSLDRRHLHRRERDCGYKERDLLVLFGGDNLQHDPAIDSNLFSRKKRHTSFEAGDGVDISTRPVSKSGNDGNPRKRNNRSADAAPNSSTFRRSTTMMKPDVDIHKMSSLAVEYRVPVSPITRKLDARTITNFFKNNLTQIQNFIRFLDFRLPWPK